MIDAKKTWKLHKPKAKQKFTPSSGLFNGNDENVNR